MFGLLISSPSLAQEKKEIPDVLDFDRREAGTYRFELSPYGGDYFSDKLNHSFIVGGNAQFNLTENLAIATDFGYSQAVVDRSSSIGASFHDDNVYLLDAGFVLTQPAAFSTKENVTECDFFTSIGGGVLRFNDESHVAGYIGGGMKIRPNISWLAIRVEIRNYFTSINNPNGSNFEDDLSIRIGPTFLLPPEM